MILSALLTLMVLTTAPVNLSVEVGRADRAVIELGKAAGISMRAVEPVASEVVFLNVQKLPVGEVMSSLARVTGASWERQDDGTFTLHRTASRIAAEKLKETNRRLKMLNDWKAKVLKGLDVPFEYASLVKLVEEHTRLSRHSNLDQEDEAITRFRELEYADPTYRALARCIRDLDLRPVAEMESGSSVVFSRKPNAVQLLLPPSAQDSATNLQADQLVWGAALNKMPLRKGQDEKTRFGSDPFLKQSDVESQDDLSERSVEPWDRAKPYRRKPAEVLLTVYCSSESVYDFDLKLLDPKGNYAMGCRLTATTWRPSDVRPYLGGADKSKARANLPKPNPSAETKALWTRLAGRGDKVKPALETLRRFFDDPVNNDPLWLENQDVFAALAKFKRKSVVACLPDSLNSFHHDNHELSLDLRHESVVSMESEAMVEVRPMSFSDHWESRVDRTRISDCIKSLRANGAIDLLSFVKLYAGRGGNAAQSFGANFAQLADPDYRVRLQAFEVPLNDAFASLLASMDSHQFSWLQSGLVIPYSELTPAQQSLAARIVFGIRVNVKEEGHFGQNRWSSISPTFELSGGLLEGAGMSMNTSDAQVAVFHYGEGSEDDFFQVPLDGDKQYLEATGPGPGIPKGGMDTVTYTLHDQPQIVIRCFLEPGHAMVGTFKAPMGKAKNKPVPLNELDSATRKKLAGPVEYLKNLYARSR